jgi:GLPGLI family protein
MKRIFFATIILLSSFCLAQTHRFIYEYNYKPDSTASDYEKTNMTLDINPDEVKFYSFEYAETDSLNKVRNFHTANWDENLPAIKRKKGTFKNFNYKLFTDFFVYETTDKMDWKLSVETKKSGDYLLQKATTNFGGRKWTAWFSKEINLSEGPYKFRGLPGLIFEISDDKRNFSFSLINSWKLPKTYDTSDFIENFAGQKAIPTTEKIIKKMELEFFNDPLRDMRENFNPNAEGEYRVYGVKITSKEQFKELTKMAQERMKKEYNPIEIDKAVKYP